MSSTRSRFSTLLVIGAGLPFFLWPPFGGVASQGVASQEEEQVITKESWHTKDPVDLVMFRAKGKEIKLGKKFAGGKDWLRGLSIKLANSSGKPLTYISLRLLFERPENDETTDVPPYVFSLTYGLPPHLSKGALTEVVPVMPTGNVELTISDEWYEQITNALRELRYPADIKKVTITVEEVVFNDGTRWNAGRLWRRDDNSPDRWVPVDNVIGGVPPNAVDFFFAPSQFK